VPSESRDLTGKHAVVTGGARGIGLAIAIALAEAGARVSIISRFVAGSKLELGVSDGEAHAFATRADVAVEEQVIEAFRLCRQQNGAIEIVVNNSGIAESAPLLRTDLAMWERIMATNLTGTFLCAREAAKDMIVAKWGRVVNVSSTAGIGGAPYISAYSASKHGVVGFTRSIAAEFDGTGITANVVCPGYTETDMLRRALENITKFTSASEETARRRLAESNPGGRIATAVEVADGVLDLITGSRNGATLVIPGGAVL
jgi:NAD(P)-dependent dehydrogenase (short-subunit alcohol dehydrogenase family)